LKNWTARRGLRANPGGKCLAAGFARRQAGFSGLQGHKGLLFALAETRSGSFRCSKN
jgi:hypothetical protein